MNNEQIIEKIQISHPDLKIVEFHKNPYMIVEDEYGKCKVQIYSLLSGSKPTINTAINKTEYFKNKLKTIQPNITVLGEYSGALKKIKVQNNYGICDCIANGLLNGQAPLITTAIDKNTYFIAQAKEIHKDRYDYSLVNYINNRTKISVICKIHGVFKQMPQGHLSTQGCKKCGDDHKTGWWYKNPENSEKMSNLYILRFLSKDEMFFKVGISVNIDKRIQKLTNECNNKYEITLEKSIKNTARYCYNVEKRFKKRLKRNNKLYIPKLNFGGKTECFVKN